ncbi:pentapeptide repeat-containing protein [Legionella sp. MW5194]|uniref:pentapeptide repeat-containing protein n=1 Tax=Legionella sp. MW5194 TaxID=2662448 RepID=UPI00193D0156|nr:pentapeptide repeat-containing protein [Legionella sp. MW5194]
MSKKLNLSIALIFLYTSANSVSIPKDVEQFKLTGHCIKCDLSSVDFLETNHSGSLNIEQSNFIRSSFSSMNANHQFSNFKNCKGMVSNISYFDLSYSDFSFSNLKNAAFVATNLTGSNFTGTDVSGVNFTEANLYNSNISEEQLKSAKILCNTVLPNGDLSDC